MKRSAVLTVCAALVLSACATSAPQSMIGPDGRPLPTLYKIDGKTAAAIPQRTQESLNALRAAKGLQPLQMNAALTAAAAAHSRDMSAQNRPWHFGSDGSSPLLRAQRAGYMGHFMGELISETYETELATLADWSSQADAKALATGPKLLLADESLGGLDETEMDQAADMLRRIRDELGITIIWVEHIMGVLMRVVDRVMVLDHGEKIAEGLPADVAGDARVIEVYLGTDADASLAAAVAEQAPRRIGA